MQSSWHAVLPLISCLLLTAGCTPPQSPLSLIYPPKLQTVQWTWQVTKADQPGRYQVAGQTDLPNRTQLTVAALRYLYPAVATAQQASLEPTYAILDYQTTTVEAGEWQTQLNLWQTAADGTFQENWQLEQQGLALRFNPQSDVVFLVTLAPIDQLPALQNQLAVQGRQLAQQSLRSSEDGERYAQSHQTISLALPSGRTSAPAANLNAENFGWGRRYLIPQEPQNPTRLEQPTERQSDAPARPEAILR
jgi:hypothetical protein